MKNSFLSSKACPTGSSYLIFDSVQFLPIEKKYWNYTGPRTNKDRLLIVFGKILLLYIERGLYNKILILKHSVHCKKNLK